MNEKTVKTDPRIVKTKRKLKTSLLKLLETHRLSEISIKALTQVADITRGTFYLHYKDKDSYVHEMMRELVDDCFTATIYSQSCESNSYPVFSLIDLLEYATERPSLFKVLLLEKDATEFHDYFMEKIAIQMDLHRHFVAAETEFHVPRELIISFLSYSLLGYIINWLEQGQIYSHHFMAEKLQKLLQSEYMKEEGLANFFVLDGKAMKIEIVKRN